MVPSLNLILIAREVAEEVEEDHHHFYPEKISLIPPDYVKKQCLGYKNTSKEGGGGGGAGGT